MESVPWDVRMVGMTRESARLPAVEPEATELHPLFVSREQAAREAVATEVPRSVAPQPPPPERKKRNADRLIGQWQTRSEPDVLARAIAQARAIPEAPGLPLANGWTEIGSGIFRSDPGNIHRSGRATSAAYAFDHRQGMTTVYLGTVGGGLWRYDWGLTRWVPVSASLEGSPSVGAFVVDPRDSRRILIGSGDGWRYAGTGLYLSTDGGSTWTRRNLDPTPASFTKVRSDRYQPQAFVCSTNVGIFRSDDRGLAWRRVWTGETSDLLQDPQYPNYWYAGAPGVGVLESNDNALTFHVINALPGTGLGAAPGRISLALCQSAPNYVYALVARNFRDFGGVYRTSNYGRTWSLIDDGTSFPIAWGQAFHANTIAVSPGSPHVVVCGMGGWQITTTGATPAPVWTRARQPGHADYTSLTFIPRPWAPSDTWLFITSDGGTCTHEYQGNQTFVDGNLMGLNTAQVLEGTHGLAVAAQNADLLLAGTQDNGVVRLDLARTATEQVQYVAAGDGGKVAFAPHSSLVAFGGSGGPPFGRIMSTGSGAAGTWTGINGTLPDGDSPTTLARWFGVLPLMFTNDGVGYLHFTHALFPNGNWLKAHGQQLPEQPVVFDMSAARLLAYVAGWSGRIYAVDVGAGTWVERTPPVNIPTGGNAPVVTADRSANKPDDAFYATGFARPSRALRTTDNGRNWTDCTGNLAVSLTEASYFQLIAMPVDRSILLLATSVGIFRSQDGGRNWFRWMDGLPAVVDVRDISITSRNGTTMVRIATNGRGFWERPAYSF